MKLRNKKTGEIYEPTSRIGFAYEDASDCWMALYHSLAELNADWEDVKEPLIKDEKIRKTIRLWAKVNGVSELTYDENSLKDIFRNEICFNQLLCLEDGYTYTITELCGEEEATEPIEPTFIDLDERIKEKEEE